MKKFIPLFLIYIGLVHSFIPQAYAMIEDKHESSTPHGPSSAPHQKKKDNLEHSEPGKKEKRAQHLPGEVESEKQLFIKNSPLVLCILDGWGERDAAPDNAITIAHKPIWERLIQEWPHTILHASGEYVGLPRGLMGNSEVGHMNLGAGRVIVQDILRINESIENGSLVDNPALKKLISSLRASKGCCHIIGLLSPGGVHSHQDHIYKLVDIITSSGVPVRFHAFLDGRDTPPQSAFGYVEELISKCSDFLQFEFATIGGRYYGMDRDHRWERTQKAYEAIVMAEGKKVSSPITAIEESYHNKITDEFLYPRVIGSYQGMQDGDGLLMANFRPDRVRQILSAIVNPSFDGFPRVQKIDLATQVGMIEYSAELNSFMQALFPALSFPNVLGEVLSHLGLRQLRIAETEKYAHVTFFFNSGREEPFVGEERILVPSPHVATYDLLPDMSARKITQQIMDVLDSKKHDFIVVNYANADMVGHTGNLEATKQAVETIDVCLGQLEKVILAHNGTFIITADHGNAEIMIDLATGQNHTAHTSSPVPFVLINPTYKNTPLRVGGSLADVAPTILNLFGLPAPSEMTGISLLNLQ